MILARKFETKDLSAIDDAIEPFSFPLPSKDFSEFAKRGIAVTETENGNVMACGGITYINDKEGMVWFKMSKKCLEHRYRWARSILETFKIMMASLGSVKISTYVLRDFCKGEKVARTIGLQKTDETEEYNGNIYHKFTAVI